jgi:hypothetical protein
MAPICGLWETPVNYHFQARPNGLWPPKSRWCSCRRHRRPSICGRVINAAAVEVGASASTPPNDHFISGPYACGVITCRRCPRCTNACPSIGGRIVTLTIAEGIVIAIDPSPNQHLSACPNGAVQISGRGSSTGRCSCPLVGPYIIACACI